MALELNSDLSKLTGARQTMLSWSKVVESFESMPEAFRSSYELTLGDVQPFPYVVFAPSITGTRRKVFDRLLCEANNRIYIWEHIGNLVTMTIYPLETISDFEIGQILLYSWITISGVTTAGVISSSTVEFNTATRRHYARFINKMRPAPIKIDKRGQGAERAKFDYLATENFKFMNFALESLVGGEKIFNTLWQPKICKRIISLGKHVLYRTTLSMAHLLVLTDREIIMIQDDERSNESRGVRYGGKWQYIPLHNIRKVLLTDHTDDLFSLSLILIPGEKHVEILFEAPRKQEIAEFQAALEKLIK